MEYLVWTLVTGLMASLRIEGTSAGLINVALNKPAQQIDTTYGGTPDRAVDGGESIMWTHGSCTKTKKRNDTWWMVDLQSDYDISIIEIFNKDSNPQWLRDFSIYVSSVDPLPIPASDGSLTGTLCVSVSGEMTRGLLEFQCTPTARGRFVYLWKPCYSPLSICEFKVLVEKPILKEIQCSVIPQHKSILAPFYTGTRSSPSLSKCVLICTSDSKYTPYHIQMDKRSGLCQCFEINGSPMTPNRTSDVNFDLCQV